MSPTVALVTRIALVAFLVGDTAGIANADDNSLSRFGGESFVAFQQEKVAGDKERSTFRRTNRGLTFSEYQALSSPGPAYHPAPAADETQSTFRQTNPSGLAFSDYQVLSSSSGLYRVDRANATPHNVSSIPLARTVP